MNIQAERGLKLDETLDLVDWLESLGKRAFADLLLFFPQLAMQVQSTSGSEAVQFAAGLRDNPHLHEEFKAITARRKFA